MTKFAMAVLATALTAGFGGAAFAQSVPEGQSCGGLLCDMGVFGHKVDPAPKDAASKPAPAAAPVAEAVPAAEQDAVPKSKHARKRKRVARTEPAETTRTPVAEPAKPAASKPAVSKPVAAKPAAPRPAKAAAAKSAAPPAKTSTASLPMPTGWDAAASPPDGLAPAATSAPSRDIVAQPAAVTATARPTPARAQPVQASPILDPFSNIPSNAPFQPLY